MALGASRGQVVAMILQQVTWLIVPGVIVGMLGAAGLSKIFRSFLYQTSPIDPKALFPESCRAAHRDCDRSSAAGQESSFDPAHGSSSCGVSQETFGTTWHRPWSCNGFGVVPEKSRSL
jgi:ABC-type antimicrobial peptide transport system permease subunit